jgi:small subunit ribosomal protein S16
MVKIRLTRVGKKKRPSYRVVIADSRAPRDGAFIEIIGHYDPLANPAAIVIDEEKAKKWLGKGAQPTERVAILLSTLGIIEKPTKKHTQRLSKKEEKKAKEASAAAAGTPAKGSEGQPAKEAKKTKEAAAAAPEGASAKVAEEKPTAEKAKKAPEKPADEAAAKG